MSPNSKSGFDLSFSVYSDFILSAVYQFYVLAFSFSYVWKCPTSTSLLPFFSQNFSRRHLDCGVGNGFFPTAALEQQSQATQTETTHPDYTITLMDANPICLQKTRRSILSKFPETQVRSVLADSRNILPTELRNSKFDSISVFNLFHCVPGGVTKFEVLHEFGKLLGENGILIGSTILGEKHTVNWLASLHLKLYNEIGIFNNRNDNLEDIAKVLRSIFPEVELTVVGMVLLFKVRNGAGR